MKPLYLNPFDPARERRKLVRSRFSWFVLILVIAPAFALFFLDRASVWAWIAGGAQGLTGWIPFVTNCGRCGTAFTFSEAISGHGLAPRINFWRWPPDRCKVCDLDRR